MGAIRDLWLKWKALRLPWRKTFLMGQDLKGNTFWEFKDAITAQRFRRIVRHNTRTRGNLSDVNVSPQWYQWMRHTRKDPPTVEEQQADIKRLAQLKVLVQAADERWASKDSFLKPPEAPKLEKGEDEIEAEGVTTTTNRAVEPKYASASRRRKAIASNEFDGQDKTTKSASRTNQWKSALDSGGPGERWQPEAWTPTPARKP